MEMLCRRYRKNLAEIRKCKKLRRFARLKALQGEQKRLRPEVERYINDIDDPVIHLILYEWVIRGRSWQSVANILGGGNTADGVRMKINRHFRQN